MNPLLFYSVADNYTSNPRCEKLNSLCCLEGLEPISRNSSYKCEWERLIPEYPFCFANGVPTLHSLLKYSLSEEKNELSAVELDVERCPGSCGPRLISPLLNSHHYCTGASASPRPRAVPLWGPEVMHFPVPADFSVSSKIIWDRIITVQGCCKSGGCIFTRLPDKRGRYATVACSRLGRWRRLKSAPCPGWCGLAVGSLAARGWQVPTKFPLRGTKLGVTVGCHSRERQSLYRKCISFSALFPQHFRNLYLCFLHFIKGTWRSKHSGNSAVKIGGVCVCVLFSFKAP